MPFLLVKSQIFLLLYQLRRGIYKGMMERGSREDSAQGEWFVLDSPTNMRAGRRIKLGNSFAFGTHVGAHVETEGEWMMLVFIFAPTLF